MKKYNLPLTLLLGVLAATTSTWAKIPSLKPVNDSISIKTVPGVTHGNMDYQYQGFAIEPNHNIGWGWHYALEARNNVGKFVLNQKKDAYLDITGELNTSTNNYTTSAAIINKDKATTFMQNKIITQDGFAIDRRDINNSLTAFTWEYLEYLPNTGKYQQHIDLYILDIQNSKLGYTSLVNPLTQDTSKAFLPYRKAVGTGDSVINFKNNIYTFNYKEFDIINGDYKNYKNRTVKIKYLNTANPNEKTFDVLTSPNPFYEKSLN